LDDLADFLGFLPLPLTAGDGRLVPVILMTICTYVMGRPMASRKKKQQETREM
jgi:hypothetical protein